ncbi:MAG: hypothetical protein P1P64_07430 [Treponemataceae bacterium]
MSCSSKGDIPDGEILFRYCSVSAMPGEQKRMPRGVFEDKELSCDWKKYRNDPTSSFHVAEEGKTDIICIKVCDAIRNPRNPRNKGKIEPAWRQEIFHDPISACQDEKHGENYAHSLIKGAKKGAVQKAIVDNSYFYPNSP